MRHCFCNSSHRVLATTSRVNQMVGNKFLNPILRLVICAAMLVILGYYLYPAAASGDLTDQMTIVRGLVFLGFAYLFAQSVRELLSHRQVRR
jgi:hypothetical protein